MGHDRSLGCALAMISMAIPSSCSHSPEKLNKMMEEAVCAKAWRMKRTWRVWGPRNSLLWLSDETRAWRGELGPECAGATLGRDYT